MKKRSWMALLPLLFVLYAGVAFAAGPLGSSGGGGWTDEIKWSGILSTVIYGVMGIMLSILGYKVYDLITPFSLTKELEEDQNVAVGIVVAGIIIGVSIIVAAAIV